MENLCQKIAQYFTENSEKIYKKLTQYEKQLEGIKTLSDQEWNEEFNI